MQKSTVAIVSYEKPLASVRRAVTLAGGLAPLSSAARVFIKPNIVFWTKATDFPKYGVITTSRVVEDMVVVLKEHGVRDISIGDGTVLREFRLTEGMAVGGLLALIAPGLAALGALVAFATDLRIQVVRIGDAPDAERDSAVQDDGES